MIAAAILCQNVSVSKLFLVWTVPVFCVLKNNGHIYLVVSLVVFTKQMDFAWKMSQVQIGVVTFHYLRLVRK